MFKNYWYFIALGAMFSIITHSLHEIWIASLFLFWLLYLFYRKRIPLIILIVTFLSFILFYLYIPSIHPPQENKFPHRPNQVLNGQIKSSVEIKETSIQFTLEEQEANTNLLVVYFFRADEIDQLKLKQLRYGAICTITGEISVPSSARNPHQFDYQRYLLKNGITYQLLVDDLANIHCNEQNALQYVYSFREKLLQVSSEKLQPETASWLQALVLGHDELIDPEIITLFQKWSLAHILAISGLHIGIVVAIIYVILVRFSLTTKEKAQSFLIMFLPIYALLAGGQPSVWRASLTVVLGIILLKWRLKISYTDIISMIFLFLIILDPYIVYHIGFQFSFLVSFALILSHNWLRQTDSNVVRILQISFISQMVILPLQIHYFFMFQPLSILLNVVVVPYFSIFVIPTLFMLFLVIFLPLPIIQFVETIFICTNELMLSFIEIVDKYFDFPMVIGTFPIYYSIIYYLFFLLFMKFIEKGDKKKALTYGIVTCCVLIVLVLRPYLSPVGKVTMLDIGQGDAYVIELPYRKGVFIIDAGAHFSFEDFTPTDKVYKQVMRPYLLGEGIYQIDAIFISHADLDHNGSVNFIVDEFNVNEVIISNYYELNETEITLWQSANLSVKRTSFNETLHRNGQDFTVLSPQHDKHSENENSLVLYTELGGAKWLFTGDIDKQTEREIIVNYPAMDIDMLKVSHHGSNTSTDPVFIKHLLPTYALISAGVDNRFGHPTEEVIQTLLGEEVIIYRTDKHGAVHYIFKDDKGYFSKFLTD